MSIKIGINGFGRIGKLSIPSSTYVEKELK